AIASLRAMASALVPGLTRAARCDRRFRVGLSTRSENGLASSISSRTRALGLLGPLRLSRRTRTMAGLGRRVSATIHRNTPAANRTDITRMSGSVISLDLDGDDLAHHEVADAHHHDGTQAHDEPAWKPGPEGGHVLGIDRVQEEEQHDRQAGNDVAGHRL